MVNGRNFLDKSVRNNVKIHENIWKIAAGQEDYTAVY